MLIVTEGSSDIGYGHVTRCTSFYQAFEEAGYRPTFVVDGDESIKRLLAGMSHLLLNWTANEESLIKKIDASDIVFVDSYLANRQLYAKIANNARLAIYYDDNNRLNYPTGIVVNGALYAGELDYPRNSDVEYLLGPKYMPLRRDFWIVSPIEIADRIESMLITFGGSDSRNLTSRILELATKKYPRLTKNVVIGDGFRHTREIELLADRKTNLICQPDAGGMRDLMLMSDLAISACGQTIQELARVGLPTVAIAAAQNQLNNARSWTKVGFIKYAGSWDDRSLDEKIQKCVGLLDDAGKRNRISRIGREVVAGNGARMVVDFIDKRLRET